MSLVELWGSITDISDRYEQVQLLKRIIQYPDVDESDTERVAIKEAAVYRLGELHTSERDAEGLATLLVQLRGMVKAMPRAKIAKLVRRLFDQLAAVNAPLELQASGCDDMIAWAKQEQQSFLRHRLQLKRAHLCFAQGDARRSLTILTELLREVRRLEDRSMLVDGHLLESIVHFSLRNYPKAKSALVVARTNANSIYCPPLQQSELDLQSGVLHASEGDYKTAFSYFFEAFEGFHGLGDHAVEAKNAMRYMILSHILGDAPNDLRAVLKARSVQEYRGSLLEGLQQLTEAVKLKDTHLFKRVTEEFGDELSDQITRSWLEVMHHRLLEGHLLKLVTPYSRVQVSFLAETLQLSPYDVEAQLSQMILDGKLAGIVDQQHECLVLFEEDHPTALYESAANALANLDAFISVLFDKVAGDTEDEPKEDQQETTSGEIAA